MFKDTRAYKLCKNITQINEGMVFKLVLNNKQVKDLIINQNTNVQLRQKHVDSLGNTLFNQYSNRTFYGKGDELGRDGKPYEVFNTGDYFDTFKIEVGEGYIIINSNPKKGEDSLFEMYTEDLEGLTDDSLTRLKELAKELYVNWIRKNIIPS